MLYILQSTYNNMLYQHIRSKGVSVICINSLAFNLLSEGDTVILDILSHKNELDFFREKQNLFCICMGGETHTHENIMYISKYQTIDTICSLIFDRENHLIVIIGGRDLFRKLQVDYPNCNFIDFTYNPDSDLSLIEILDNYETDLVIKLRDSRSKILYPIGNIMDLLDPPTRFIEPLLNTLKINSDTFIQIDHLKGSLDLMLLKLSNLIIFVHDNDEPIHNKLDSAIEKIMSHKKIISLNTYTKAYDQFRLSEHLLYKKEN